MAKLTLVASNSPELVESARIFYAELRAYADNPRPAEHHDTCTWGYPAEHLQADEQAEANGIAELFAFGFACFGGGCLATATACLIIIKLL